jgi:WNK lysine deficient protein kinase
MIMDEILLLKELSPKSEYIINILCAWCDMESGQIIFITELALGGTLKEYILHIEKINLRVIKKWCIQILRGIEFLHSNNVAHRDLKCNNIFMHPNTGDIVIGDLGLAKERKTNFHSVIGTPEYMAPEMFSESYDEKVDIYAFGLCLLEMITKKVPFSKCGGIGSLYKKIVDGEKPPELKRVKNCKAKDIIKQCISFDPKDRPTAKELLGNKFFEAVDNGEDDDENLTQSSEDLLVELEKEKERGVDIEAFILYNLDEFIKKKSL